MISKVFIVASALSVLLAASQTITLAGYKTSTDVREHAKIDLDVKQMDKFLAAGNFPGAKNVYMNGKNSKKTGGKRTLRGFSADAKTKLRGENCFIVYSKYWNKPNYADKVVMNALTANGDMNGKSKEFRAQVALKGAQYMNVWMYVLHEMEDAVKDCKKKNLSDNDGGVKAWDEAVAFYCGKSVLASGNGNGYLLYTLAQKRCTNFGTCKGGGKAKVNINVMQLFKQGKFLLEKSNCGSAERKLKSIKQQMTVPLVQGCLRYLYKAETETGTDKVNSHAEGWAFCTAVLPQISKCDRSVGNLVMRNLAPSNKNPVSSGANVVAKGIYKTLRCMGINCADIGKLPGLVKC